MGQESCEYFLTIKIRLGKTTTALPSTDLHVLPPVDVIGIMLNQQIMRVGRHSSCQSNIYESPDPIENSS